MSSLNGINDSKNISQFFNQEHNDLGLEGTSSPEKDPFKRPFVPVCFGGPSETFDIGRKDTLHDDRRDTVSTIKVNFYICIVILYNYYFDTIH